MSTVWPAWRRPPTARSSGTVIETARQAGESGATVSVGPRIENWEPWVWPASMLARTIWPSRMGTPATSPAILAGSAKTPLAFVPSTGTSRTTRSPASMTFRLGISLAATTTAVVWRPAWLACCWTPVRRMNAAAPAKRASTSPMATMNLPRRPGSRYSSSIVGAASDSDRGCPAHASPVFPGIQSSVGASCRPIRPKYRPAHPIGRIERTARPRRVGSASARAGGYGRTRWTGLPRMETCQVVVSVVVLSNGRASTTPHIRVTSGGRVFFEAAGQSHP